MSFFEEITPVQYIEGIVKNIKCGYWKDFEELLCDLEIDLIVLKQEISESGE